MSQLATVNDPPAKTDAVAIIQVLERVAANPDVPVEKIERLMDMQMKIMARNAEVSFNAAMAAMQSELPVITKRGEIKVNGTVRSTFAKFEDINEAVKPIMHRHGFAVSFRTKTDASSVTVTGILMHKDGHREETDITLGADNSGGKNGVQAIGSSVAYGKRYVMSALLNISTEEEDDDGQAAGRGQTISAGQVADLEALIQEVKADRAKFLRYLKLSRLEDMNVSAYDNAVAELRRKGKSNAAGK